MSGSPWSDMPVPKQRVSKSNYERNRHETDYDVSEAIAIQIEMVPVWLRLSLKVTRDGGPTKFWQAVRSFCRFRLFKCLVIGVIGGLVLALVIVDPVDVISLAFLLVCLVGFAFIVFAIWAFILTFLLACIQDIRYHRWRRMKWTDKKGF